MFLWVQCIDYLEDRLQELYFKSRQLYSYSSRHLRNYASEQVLESAPNSKVLADAVG